MVEIVSDRIFTAIVCADIDPALGDEAYDRLDSELLHLYNGTESSPWEAVRKGPQGSEPVPCHDNPNRWHYVVSIKWSWKAAVEAYASGEER